jgi:hypothetical protein
MSRWKAASLHLLLSGLIVGSVLTFMVMVWYRWPLFEIAGGSGLTLILASVDMTLGPLITLVIFKSGKKGLKFDLAAIALLQATALAYGVHVVYVARPVFLVFAYDRFNVVTAKDINPQDLKKVTREEFRRLPLGRPPYIAAEPPRDPNAQTDILFSALGGKDLELYPQYYVPYEQEAQIALRHARPLDILLGRDPRAVHAFLDAAGRTPDSVKFLPLRARTDAAVLIDAVSARPLDIVRVNPW